MFKLIFSILLFNYSLQFRIPLKRQQFSNGIISLTNLTNFQYQADISLGSPSQYCNVAIDTGIGQTWINTINGHYEISHSKTANISQMIITIDYGMGSISGYQGTELLNISTITNLTFSMIFANVVTNTGVEADGVLGLSNNPNYKNPFETGVTTGQLSDSQFGFYLKDPTANSTSQFYITSTSFPTQLTWISTSMNNYWSMSITNTQVGMMSYPAAVTDSQGIVDSGTTMLLIGKSFFIIFLSGCVGAFQGLVANINNQCSLVNSLYICVCPGSIGTNYPNIVFSTANLNLTVVPSNYMITLSGGYCVMAIDQQNQLPVMILGDSLMNNYFVAFDKSQNKIGFSSPLKTQYIKEDYVSSIKQKLKR